MSTLLDTWSLFTFIFILSGSSQAKSVHSFFRNIGSQLGEVIEWLYLIELVDWCMYISILLILARSYSSYIQLDLREWYSAVSNRLHNYPSILKCLRILCFFISPLVSKSAISCLNLTSIFALSRLNATSSNSSPGSASLLPELSHAYLPKRVCRSLRLWNVKIGGFFFAPDRIWRMTPWSTLWNLGLDV